MSGHVYSLDIANFFLTHYDGGGLMCARDKEAIDKTQVDVQVRSGDYFATLATTLDELSRILGRRDEAISQKLQLVVNELLYLQGKYTISPKEQPYRNLKNR